MIVDQNVASINARGFPVQVVIVCKLRSIRSANSKRGAAIHIAEFLRGIAELKELSRF